MWQGIIFWRTSSYSTVRNAPSAILLKSGKPIHLAVTYVLNACGNGGNIEQFVPSVRKSLLKLLATVEKDVKTFKPTITRSAHNQRLFNAMPISWSISIPLLIVLIFCFPFSNITKLHSMSVLVPIICSSVFVYFNVRQNNEIRQWRENFSSMIYYCSWFILLHIISILVIFIIVYVYELVFGIDLFDWCSPFNLQGALKYWKNTWKLSSSSMQHA